MNRLRKAVLIGLSVLTMVVMVSLVGHNSDAASRDENIQKIKNFLSNEAVANGLTEKGGSAEKMIQQLDSLSDVQLEKLASHANLQVGGAIEDSEVATFWKTWGLYMIVGTVLFVVLLVVV